MCRLTLISTFDSSDITDFSVLRAVCSVSGETCPVHVLDGRGCKEEVRQAKRIAMRFGGFSFFFKVFLLSQLDVWLLV